MKDESDKAFSDSSFILHHSSFGSLASYGSRTRSNTSTGCHAIRYTNETQSTGRAGESNPRHDIHSVACCHYTKLAIATFSRWACPARRQSAKRTRRDSNPHRPNERPRLANACDETDIRLSSKQCPRQESNLDFELRTLAWSPFHHRDSKPRMNDEGIRMNQKSIRLIHPSSFPPSSFRNLPPPGFEPGTQRSKRRMIIRFNTEALLPIHPSTFIL